MRRVLPAFGLFLTAPLVSEYLLGNMSITTLGVLIVLAPMYGGGALLIREVTRRAGRGWPTILTLALAFGIAEEAFMTQTLFNPNYLGLNLHLLEPAFIPSLGISAWWTVFVLTLHTVWSISVSIALIEALVPDRSTTPWLGWIGLPITAILFVLSSASITSYTIKQDQNHFIASHKQLATSAVILVALVVFAFFWPRRSQARSEKPVPSPSLVGFIALLASSIFLVFPNRFAWWTVAVYLALDLAVIAAVGVWSRRANWDGSHRLSLAAGAALAYAWHAFIQAPAVGNQGTVNRVGNIIFALGAIALIAVGARKNRTAPKAMHAAQ